MYSIKIFYVQGTTSSGKKYKVPHTTDLGFNCTIQLNGNSKSNIHYDPILNCDVLTYDPMKAGLAPNSRGYMELRITD